MSERSAERPELQFVPRAFRDLFLPRRLPREVRIAIEQWLEAEPLSRLLPAAFELPLLPELNLTHILADARHLAIVGPPASGRSLALAQIARQWLNSQMTVPLVRLLLSDIDIPSLTPRAIVVRALARRNLAPNPLEHNLPCLLIIDDWEELPLARRAIWQRFLVNLSERWPKARVVIALPSGELWPGFTHRAIAPLSDEQLATWIQILFPHSDPQTLFPLFERDPLVMLRERPAELIMLALTQPLSGWPVSRAALYERMAAFATPILATTNDQAGWRIGASARHVYQQAVELAAQSRLEPKTIRSAGAQWRAFCLPLAFGVTLDPQPLITALAASELPNGERLLLLARALRERPRLDPALSRPLLEEMCQYGGEALNMLVPALPIILTDIGRTQSGQVTLLLERIVVQLAPKASHKLLMTFLDATDAPPPLRWHAIDLLCQQQMTPPPLPEYTDLIGQAGRCLLAVSSGNAYSWLTNPALQLGLRLLLSGAAGTERQRTIAHYLLQHTELPAPIRALAPAALSTTDLERAAADPAAEVRRAARAVWLRTGQVGHVARFIMQTHQPWVARDEALADLTLDKDGQSFLIGFALSNRLSLDVRLRAIRFLHRLDSGQMLLKRLLDTESELTIVRAAAAYQFVHYPQAVPFLQSYVSYQHPPLLRRAVVQTLAQIAAQNHAAAAAARKILHDLAYQPDIDSELTITIITALGQYGGAEAITTLGYLLAPIYGVHVLQEWIKTLPALIGPAERWLSAATESTRAILADLIVHSDTVANRSCCILDRPSVLVAHHVLRVSSAAVRAVTQIGQLHPHLYPATKALLEIVLYDASAPRPLTDLLAVFTTPELARLAREAVHDHPLRMIALRAIADRPDGAQTLIQLAEATDRDLACNALDQIRPPFSAEVRDALLRLANSSSETVIRLTALQALGRSSDPTVTPTLMTIVDNEHEAVDIRIAALHAATAIPVTRLIDIITTHPEPLRSAALYALKRSDRPAPANLLHRMAFDADRTCALAAVDALAGQIPTTTSILLRIVRSHPDLSIRLAAAAALRDTATEDVLPVFIEGLLAPYPALQTQAFTLLATIDPHHPALRQVLADPNTPEVLKSLAVQHLSTHTPSDPLIRAVAIHPEHSEQLRCLAIRALAQQADEATIKDLAQLATEAETQPLSIRYAAVMAIVSNCTAGNTAARNALANLATSSIPEIDLWAGSALLTCLIPIEQAER